MAASAVGCREDSSWVWKGNSGHKTLREPSFRGAEEPSWQEQESGWKAAM